MSSVTAAAMLLPYFTPMHTQRLFCHLLIKKGKVQDWYMNGVLEYVGVS